MKFFKGVKDKSVKTGKRLVGYDQLNQGLRNNVSIAKEIYDANTKEVVSDQETFQIPVESVVGAQKGFKNILVIFLGLFGFAVLYFVMNLIAGRWIIALLTVAFAVLCLSIAFRYHFWLYQIKKKTLGLNFADYYRDEIAPLWKKPKPNKKEKK